MTEFQIFRHRLDNGLELAVLPDPHSPAVAVNLSFQVGSVDEVPGRTGFAHLFEHLMFQGSSQVASGEHMALIEAVGGSVNAYTSSDRTVYHETVPPGALELVLWLEADRLRSLAVTQENLDTQRDVVIQEKHQRFDNRPYGDMLEALVAQHFAPPHPYGHLPIGVIADLEAASLADVAAFHSRWYQPTQARLVICGAVTADEAVTLVERHFGDLPAAPSPERPPITTPALPGQTRTMTGDVPHPLLHCSWLAPAAPDPAHVALELGIAITTEGHASRLHRRLVKDLGIAHEVHGVVLPHLRASSIASVLARPAEGVATELLAEAVLSELAGFGEPTERELARAKAQQERSWLEAFATVEDRADAAADAWLTHGDPEHLNRQLDDIAAVTADDVSHAMATRTAASQLHYLPRTQP
ncbi:MAG: pitrilysin family protein [Propionibacteriaceae bacterium]|nr:pitrilysin family protein [Propionibacteriaceae bacterium]